MTGVWNLTELYAGIDDPRIEADMQLAEDRATAFADKWSNDDRYMREPVHLRAALDDYEELIGTVGTGNTPLYYVSLSRRIDLSNPELKSLEEKLSLRSRALDAKMQFFVLSIGKMSVATQQRMLHADELKPYHVWLERRFEHASHDLSEDAQNVVRELLPLATSSWSSMLNGTLAAAKARLHVNGKPQLVPFNSLGSYVEGNDADLAKRANDAHVRIVQRHANTAEHELNAVIQAKTRMSKLRGYDRPDGASFLRYHLTADIVESLLGAVERRYDISQNVYELKAELFGRDKLEYHERILAYGSLPSGYQFEDAARMLREVLETLHLDFVMEFDKALDSGHIDWRPRSGKKGGASCSRSLISLPPYLMLNFGGNLADVLTLAHEFGHYLNNLYMQRGGRCSSLTYGAPTPLAEVASTFFEEFVLDAIVKECDEKTRLAVLVSSLGRKVSSVFRQTAATRFEQALYREVDAQGYLSKKQIGELFARHMADYMGPYIDLKAGAHLGWVHWRHFRLGFYNYAYTFAQLVSMSLQERVRRDVGYMDEIVRLLETGSSLPTPELMQFMQLDISSGGVWQAGLNKMQAQLDEARALASELHT